MPKLSRRDVLRASGVAAAGIALGAGGALAGEHVYAAGATTPSDTIVPFYGAHQAGIVTPAQDRLHFAAFDLTTTRASDVRSLLLLWSNAAATLCSGVPIGQGDAPPESPPPDTGEALNLGAAHLTITIGLGPSLFTQDGHDRFGLAARRPAALIDLPPFAGEALDPERSGGDLCVQACADDPQVAFHAVRNLARLARGLAVMRWSQLGFGRTASTSQAQATPRNLMGFKDGTDNLKSEDVAQVDQFVWAGASDQPAWMVGGSYVVTRRIRMHLEAWDRDFLADQEATIGRHKVSGAPLGGQHEFDPVNLTAQDATGTPIIAPKAHVRLAIGDGATKILRRGYSFTDGMDPVTGELDAGLFFIAYQRDPRTQFVPLQQRLATQDALNEYITHNGSAIFACPPGIAPGGFIGAALFD